MRIAICEDKKEHADILKNMILRWAEKENLKVDIGYYQSAEQFLFYMNEDAHYDLAFLDIQLERMSGIELAKFIRKQDKTIFLVFTTGVSDYAVKGYEVSAFRYLVKPLKEVDIASTLSKISRMITEKDTDAIIVSFGGVLKRIYKDDIVYVEIDNHDVIFHTKTELIKFKAKLRDFEEQLKEPRFCKCHRSFIVNLHYVGQISKEGVYFGNGEILPVSRARWDDLNRCYLAYYTNR